MTGTTKRLEVILLVGILLIGFTNAEGPLFTKGEDDPRKHPNLSPFDKWRSAYECLQKNSTSCLPKYQLTPVGWVNVTNADSTSYCTGGCADHARQLLQCLDDVMRGEYKFQSGETVKNINDTIAAGCKPGGPGFAGKDEYATPKASGGMRHIGNMAATYAIALLAWLFISNINM